MARTDARITLLLEVLDAAFDRRAWNGTNLRRSLRGVTAKDAAWRPGRGRPSIWALVLHCAYWKHTVMRRLFGEAAGDFPRAPANFPAVPARPTAAAWAADIRLLEAQHRRFRRLVETMRPRMLEHRGRGRWRNIEQIHGVAAHDAYHTGQIRLIRKLAGR